MDRTIGGARGPDGLLRTVLDPEGEAHALIGAPDASPGLERAGAWVAMTHQRAILDALPANVSLLDATGRIVAVNESWRRFADDNSLGSLSEGVGQNYLAVCDAADGAFSSEAPRVAAGIRAVLSGSSDEFTLEYPCDAPGRPGWFRLSVRPVRGVEGAVVMHVDITHERAAVLALRESEARLRAIVDNVPECVKLVSIEGRLIDINPAGLRLLGADRLADVRGCSTVELVHPGDRAAYEALHRGAVAGESGRIEVRCVGLCGVERWLEIHSTPLRAPDGSVGTVLSIARDISQQRRAEDERGALLLREQVDRRHADEASRYYRSLFASAPGCYLVLTPDHSTIVEASEAFLRVTATHRIQIIGRSLFEVFPDDPDDPKADGVKSLRASLDRVIATRQADVMAVQRYPIRRPSVEGDGLETRYWSMVNSPVPGPNGALAYIICRVEDVTEYIQIKRQQGEGAAARVTLDSRAEQMEADILLRSLELKRANERMAQDQGILRIAGRVARLGGWMVRVADRSVRWSDETAAIHEESVEYSPTVEEGRRFYAPEYRELIRQSFERCASTGEPFDVEAQIITSRGRRVWVRVIGEALRGPAGEITHIQGALQDISEQKAADEQIRNLGERLMNTMESIPDGFCTIGLDWRFTYLNAAAERILERDRRDLLGRSMWAEFGAAVGGRFAAGVRGVRSSGLPARFEEFYAPLNRWFEVEAYPSSEGLAVYLRDVGERRKSREALRERDERLREQAALLDHARDAILVSDLEQRVLYWNRSAERLYGWTAAEAAGRPVTELIYAETMAFRVALDVTLARGEWVGELEQRTKGGQSRIIEGHWTLVRDDRGAPRSIFVISTDITERKKLEAQFLRAQRMESIGALASGIAHDLNNVLAPILMTVSLLGEDETDPTRRDDLLAIESCAQRGAEMVRHLLSFGRGVDGRRAPLDLGHFASEIRKMARDTFPKNIAFQLHQARGLWQVSADPTQMHQVLINLCVNARDSMMPDGGTLTITIENVILDEVYAQMNPDAQPGPFVLARVEDTGTGIAPEILGQVFEPFFTTKEIGHGTGLGLSTVHAIVRNHGGFVMVSSEVGRGSCFKVHLPALEPTHAPVEDVGDRSSTPRGVGELVLLVDDEEMIRSSARRTLERHGYRVLLASNGAEAVAIFAQHRDDIAVVVTDMTMPVMDGFATIVALRMIEPTVRVIGSSGINTDANIARANSVGVRSFVPKPYSGDTLLRVLQRVLSEPA